MSISTEQRMYTAMREAAEASTAPTAPTVDATDTDKLLKREMTMFDSGSDRAVNLDCAYRGLMSVPPTSVESERAFSAATMIQTKGRSRLSPVLLNAICLLRSYFNKTCGQN